MGYTIAQKIIKNHLVCGEMTVGSDIGLKIDQTLTQDATGTMAYIEYEAMGIPRVKTEKSVAYIDHNIFKACLRLASLSPKLLPKAIYAMDIKLPPASL